MASGRAVLSPQGGGGPHVVTGRRRDAGAEMLGGRLTVAPGPTGDRRKSTRQLGPPEWTLVTRDAPRGTRPGQTCVRGAVW